MDWLGTLHQGRKSYVAGAALVLLGLGVALGYVTPDAETAGAGIALVGLLGLALRAGGKKLELWIEERTGFDIPDELVDKLAERAGEAAAKRIESALATTPESPGVVIVRPEDPA